MGAITKILLLAFTATAAMAASATTPVTSASPTTTAGIFNELYSDLKKADPALRKYANTLFTVSRNDSIDSFNNVLFAGVRVSDIFNDAVGAVYDNNITFTTRQARRLINFLNDQFKPTVRRTVNAYIAAHPAFKRIGEEADGGVYAYNDATYINEINSFINLKVPKAQQTAVAEISSSLSRYYASATSLYGFTGFPDVPFKRAAPTAA